MELKAIGRKGANFDSLPMRDGVDFAILLILKITRKARCNVWVSITTKAQMV